MMAKLASSSIFASICPGGGCVSPCVAAAPACDAEGVQRSTPDRSLAWASSAPLVVSRHCEQQQHQVRLLPCLRRRRRSLEGMFTSSMRCRVGLRLPPFLVVGGFGPPRGSSSSGVLGTLVLAASDFSVSDDVIQPARSASKKQVEFDLLHKMATKNCVASLERWSASGSVIRPPVARKTGSLQELGCNFLFF